MKLVKQYAKEAFEGRVNMSLSTNPLGCSPRVLKRLKTVTEADLTAYPPKQRLTNLIAKKLGVSANDIVLGNGSEQLIKLVCQSFLKPKDVALVPRGSFVQFTVEPQLKGIKVTFLEEAKFIKPKLIFVANPQTPTGEVEKRNTLLKLIKSFPNTIVVVDEANGEFCEESLIKNAINTTNCIVLKTFSKTFGLAGLRIGFAVGPKRLIAKLSANQQPFPVTSLSMILAEEALKDTKFLSKTRDFIKRERTFLQNELRKRGFTVSNSVTNNLFISGRNIDRIRKRLETSGVSVINSTFFPGLLTSGFRISIKDKRKNRLLLEKLDQAIKTINHHAV